MRSRRAAQTAQLPERTCARRSAGARLGRSRTTGHPDCHAGTPRTTSSSPLKLTASLRPNRRYTCGLRRRLNCVAGVVSETGACGPIGWTARW